MNKKIVLAMLSVLLTNSSIAMEMINGKLISHKEWVSGNATGSFLENHNPNNLPKKLHTSPKNSSTEDSRTFLDVNSIVLPPAYIQGKKTVATDAIERINIANQTSQSHTYYIVYNLCDWAEGTTEPLGCVHAEDEILLESKGSVEMTLSPSIEMALQFGYYNTTLTTFVMSGDTTSNFTTMTEFTVSKSGEISVR